MYDALDADIVHNNVCMDAGGTGSVLDSVEHIWHNPNADYKKAGAIKKVLAFIPGTV